MSVLNYESSTNYFKINFIQFYEIIKFTFLLKFQNDEVIS